MPNMFHIILLRQLTSHGYISKYLLHHRKLPLSKRLSCVTNNSFSPATFSLFGNNKMSYRILKQAQAFAMFLRVPSITTGIPVAWLDLLCWYIGDTGTKSSAHSITMIVAIIVCFRLGNICISIFHTAIYKIIYRGIHHRLHNYIRHTVSLIFHHGNRVVVDPVYFRNIKQRTANEDNNNKKKYQFSVSHLLSFAHLIKTLIPALHPIFHWSRMIRKVCNLYVNN